MTSRYYHGTRRDLSPGASIDPGPDQVLLTPTLDEAIWDAELAEGESPARVYIVEPTGAVERVATRPGPPTMSWVSRGPLRVTGEVTEWLHYHGTRADLKIGDLIKPGHLANYGPAPRTANYIYFSRTLDAAAWGAELAAGEGRGRIYIVEPTGPVEDDPNLTNKKFRGNPTRSFRSRSPLRITGELAEWQGHTPGQIKAMKDGLERLRKSGLAEIDD